MDVKLIGLERNVKKNVPGISKQQKILPIKQQEQQRIVFAKRHI